MRQKIPARGLRWCGTLTLASLIDLKLLVVQLFTSTSEKCMDEGDNKTSAVDATVTNAQQLKSWKEIPGPARLPIIGQSYHFFPGGDLHNLNGVNFGAQLYKYGPIVRLDELIGRIPSIFLFDPESCAHILRSENLYPIRPGFDSLKYFKLEYSKANKSTTKSNFNGVLIDYGDVWKQFRSAVNPVVLQPKTIKLYSVMTDQVAQDMVARLKSLRGSDNTIQGDFEMEMSLWALESIALVALGRRLGSFDSQLPPNSPEKRLIYVINEIFKAIDLLDFFKPSLWKIFPTKTFKRAMKLYEEQEYLTRYFIDKTIEELGNREGTVADDQKGVLEKMLEINKDCAVTLALDILFGGVNTTSNSFTATLYLLANNQEKQDKLREEIRSTPYHNGTRPYLKACLKESIRMMPVAGGNSRVTTKEYEMLGYKIPAGVQIVFMHQTMSMMEEQFPRAEEYLPERWLVKKDDPLYYANAHPFAYQPFGFGARSCIGRRIAALELETFLARFIENFKVEWFGPPVTTKTAAINYVKGPFNFIFKDV